jgi:ParB family transcriptional regulator, chromosome partitioning protein
MEKSKRKALGKGLGALIPTGPRSERAESGAGILMCPIGRLNPNQEQPRQSFDEAKLRELTESIRSKGILQPLIARQSGEDYEIIAGERRWRAAKLAGLKAVPILVKEASDAEVIEMALVENIQREDLNPLEEAEAYRQLVEEHQYTQEQLADQVGRQRSTVANTLRLLKLPREVQEFIWSGDLGMGHARAFLGLPSEAAQIKLAKRAAKDKLSVRQCENLVRQGAAAKGKAHRQRQHTNTPAELRVIEQMQRRLGTKVDLRAKRKGGQVVIHYYSADELHRVLSVIEGNL